MVHSSLGRLWIAATVKTASPEEIAGVEQQYINLYNGKPRRQSSAIWLKLERLIWKAQLVIGTMLSTRALEMKIDVFLITLAAITSLSISADHRPNGWLLSQPWLETFLLTGFFSEI